MKMTLLSITLVPSTGTWEKCVACNWMNFCIIRRPGGDPCPETAIFSVCIGGTFCGRRTSAQAIHCLHPAHDRVSSANRRTKAERVFFPLNEQNLFARGESWNQGLFDEC